MIHEDFEDSADAECFLMMKPWKPTKMVLPPDVPPYNKSRTIRTARKALETAFPYKKVAWAIDGYLTGGAFFRPFSFPFSTGVAALVLYSLLYLTVVAAWRSCSIFYENVHVSKHS